MEIERKFVLNELPFKLDGFEKIDIKQGYIAENPTLRIRQWNDQYILTVKTKSKSNIDPLFAREETEVELSKEEFDNLQTRVETSTISKTRYLVPLENGLVAELDTYYGDLDGLMTVEVEFQSAKDALSFTPPYWFGEEVTFDNSYSNNFMSRYGCPKKSNK